MDSFIWGAIIVVSVILVILSLLLSVTALHKKFIEKPFEKIEKKNSD
jgi:hypothetical protein